MRRSIYHEEVEKHEGKFETRSGILESLQDRNLVCLDGGATEHITNNGDLCHNRGPTAMAVMGATGVAVPCAGSGSLHLLPESGSGLPVVVIADAYIAEDFPYSFISESRLVATGCTIVKEGISAVVLGPKILAGLCSRLPGGMGTSLSMELCRS